MTTNALTLLPWGSGVSLLPPLESGWDFDCFDQQNLAEVTPSPGNKGTWLLSGSLEWSLLGHSLLGRSLSKHCIAKKKVSFGPHVNKPTCRHCGQPFSHSYQAARNLNEESILEVGPPAPGPSHLSLPSGAPARQGERPAIHLKSWPLESMNIIKWLFFFCHRSWGGLLYSNSK